MYLHRVCICTYTVCASVHCVCICTPCVHLYTVCASVHCVCICTLCVHLYTMCASVHRVCICTLCVHLYTMCAPVHHVCICTLSAGYFDSLRNVLESSVPTTDQPSLIAPTPLAESLIRLIVAPLLVQQPDKRCVCVWCVCVCGVCVWVGVWGVWVCR